MAAAPAGASQAPLFQTTPGGGGPDDREAEIARRLLALTTGPVSAETVRQVLAWVASEVQASGTAMRAARADVAALSRRLAELEARDAATDSPSGTTPGAAPPVAPQVAGLEAAVRDMHSRQAQIGDRLAALEGRLAGAAGPERVRDDLDRLAVEVSGAPDVARLEASVKDLRAGVDRITRAQAAGQQDALAHVAGRTAPLEGALHELRRELELLSDQSEASQEAVRAEVAERIAALASRLDALESRPGTGGPGTKVVDMADHLAAVEARLSSVDNRTMALAALAADVETMYQELDRVSEQSKVRDGTVAKLADWASPVEVLVTALREQIDRVAVDVAAQRTALEETERRVEEVAQEGQATELDLRRRLGSVEPLSGELEGMYRELGRMASTTSEAREALVALDAAASTHGEALEDLRRRLDQTRSWVDEAASGLAARLRELELLPPQVERVAVELDQLTAELGDTRQDAAARHGALTASLARLEPVPADLERVYQRLDQLGTDLAEARAESAKGLEAAAARILALQALPADVEALYRELDRFAEANRHRGEQLAAVESRAASLEALAELRADVDRVAAELRGELDNLGSELVEARGDTATRLEAVLGLVRELERLPAEIAAVSHDVERLDDLDRRRGEQLAIMEGRIGPEGVARLEAQLEAATASIRNLATLPAEVEGVYRELDRLSELVRSRADELAALDERFVAPDVVAGLESELRALAAEVGGATQALQARLGDVESLPATVEGVAADLDRLSGELGTARDEARTQLDWMAVAMESLRAGVTAFESLPADVEGLYRELHRLDDLGRRTEAQLADLEGRTVPADAVTNLRGDLDRLADRLTSLPPAVDDVRRDVEATIAGVRRDLAGLARDTAAIRDEAGKAFAPVHDAIDKLRRDLEGLREAEAAAEADDALAFEGLKDLDARLRAVESLPERVEKVFRELSRASGDVVNRQQASLDEAVAKVDEIEHRLAAVESLPADLEGLYAALYRIAESVKALREGHEGD